jgi:hypothetical protein
MDKSVKVRLNQEQTSAVKIRRGVKQVYSLSFCSNFRANSLPRYFGDFKIEDK